VNAESNKIAIFISYSQSEGLCRLWPDQSKATAIQSIDRSGAGRFLSSAEQTPPDSYKDRSSGAVAYERFGRTSGYALADLQSSLTWPTESQWGSGSSTAAGVTIRLIDANETSLIDPYSSVQATAPGAPDYESNRLFVGAWVNPKGLAETDANIQVCKELASPILAENWDKQDDLRFDLLVEKEAMGEISLEEEKELERLSDKRDRTVARVSDEDLWRARMRNTALTQLRSLLEKYARLFA
jgi:hypothetical protein